MGDQASETLLVAAPIESVFAVIADVEHYPEWAPDVSTVEVLDHDEANRPRDVKFSADFSGRTTTYTLRYDWSQAPAAVSWTQQSGDVTSRVDGSYELNAKGDGTEVRYSLSVDLKVPLPGFVKRRAESRIIGTALRGLQTRVEASA